MPAKFLAEDLKGRDALHLLYEEKMQSLAKRYKVSPQSMAVRLSHIGYLLTLAFSTSLTRSFTNGPGVRRVLTAS